jgi:hypothetical protein
VDLPPEKESVRSLRAVVATMPIKWSDGNSQNRMEFGWCDLLGFLRILYVDPNVKVTIRSQIQFSHWNSQKADEKKSERWVSL